MAETEILSYNKENDIKMLQQTPYQKVYYILRISIAMCFIGHGAFGIVTKPVWCNYFAVMGIGHDLSYRLMPVVGCVDILLGLLMLIRPVKAIPAWLVIWGIFTALLRPLSGESFAELIERSGNFGAPLALLVLTGGSATVKGWFTRICCKDEPDTAVRTRLAVCLRIVVCLFLAGHGWLNLLEKKSLLQQYAMVGFFNPMQVAQLAGIAEISFACIVLIRPLRPMLFTFLIWKVGTELFYPHYALLEWIERAGSYGTLLALWLVTEKVTISQNVSRWLPGSRYFTIEQTKAG